MLSKELYIMDKNMERLMVSQLQEEVTAAKAERDKIVAERNEAAAERDEAVAERNEAVAERNEAVAERNEAVAERNEAVTKLAVFKLKYQSKTPEEIADKLGLSVEYVTSVLNEL